MSFFTIIMKSQLVMPKTNKKQNRKSENLFTNYIFLKVVVSNIRDVFDANHFTQQLILHQQFTI